MSSTKDNTKGTKSSELSPQEKREVLRESIKQAKGQIYIAELKDRFWQRKIITEGRNAEAMLGLVQADRRKIIDWLAFLEEVKES